MASHAIFVSHSHFDNEFCRRLCEYLQQRMPSADIFYDESELHGGDEWAQRIQSEVVARSVFIVVLSRHSVAAEWVREETNLALSRSVRDRSRRVIPVQIDPGIGPAEIDQLAPMLTMRQIVDLTPSAPQSHWEDMLKVVRGEISGDAPKVNPSVLADLERASDFAAQTHEAFAVQNWRTVTRVGAFAVTLPGNERDSALWGELGIARVRVGEWKDALAALDKALELNRFRGDLWLAKADALAALDRFDEAMVAWGTAIVTTGSPDGKDKILTQEYQVLTAKKRVKEAQAVVEEALELATANPEWTKHRLEAIQSSPVTSYNATSRKLDWLSARYEWCVQRGFWAEAIIVVSAALSLDQYDSSWRQRKLETLTNLHRDREARDYARDIGRDNNSYPAKRGTESVAKWLTRRYAQSEQAHDQQGMLAVTEDAIALWIWSDDWVQRRLDILTALGMSTEARGFAQDIQENHRIQRKAAETWVQAHYAAAAAAGDNAGILSASEIAQVLGLSIETWLPRRLDALVALGRDQEAIQAADEQVRKALAPVAAWAAAAFTRYQTANNWGLALAVANIMLMVRPKDVLWLRRKLNTCEQLRRTSEALNIARALTTLAGATAVDWAARARLADQAPNADEVVSALDKAIALGGRKDETIANLCVVLLDGPQGDLAPELSARGYRAQIVNEVRVILPPLIEMPATSIKMGGSFLGGGHFVKLAGFSLAKYRLTEAEIRTSSHSATSSSTKAIPPDSASSTSLSWSSAIAYLAWLSSVTGIPWRLPTEAEWLSVSQSSYAGEMHRDQSFEWTSTIAMEGTYQEDIGHEAISSDLDRVLRGRSGRTTHATAYLSGVAGVRLARGGSAFLNLNYGTAFSKQGNHVAALPFYRYVTEVDTKNAEAWSNLITTLRALGREDEARDAAQHASPK